jgi:hypothetical protein
MGVSFSGYRQRAIAADEAAESIGIAGVERAGD